MVDFAGFGAAGLAAGVCLWEIFWRLRGFVPSVRDDWPAWALARRCAYLKGSRALALLGASRIQVALEPEAMATLTGRRPVMLAIDGCSPFGVLADLAGDPRFRGTVICSLMPVWLAGAGGADDRAAKWVRKSRRLSLGGACAWRLWIACQATLACLSPDLTPARLLAAIKSGAWPRPHRAPMTSDRFRRLDCRHIDVARLRLSRRRREAQLHAAARPLPPALFEAHLDRIESSVTAIQRRGGRVIFLRLPSSGAILEMEERTWPRSRYWDRLCSRSSARTIHFADYPQLTGFRCPDGSHLAVQDARRFTEALVGVLRAGDG